MERLSDRGRRPPRRLETQKREEFLRRLREAAPQALKQLWAESERKGLIQITPRQINAEIKMRREERRPAEPSFRRTR
jgi:hypothetical protein